MPPACLDAQPKKKNAFCYEKKNRFGPDLRIKNVLAMKKKRFPGPARSRKKTEITFVFFYSLVRVGVRAAAGNSARMRGCKDS